MKITYDVLFFLFFVIIFILIIDGKNIWSGWVTKKGWTKIGERKELKQGIELNITIWRNDKTGEIREDYYTVDYR